MTWGLFSMMVLTIVMLRHQLETRADRARDRAIHRPSFHLLPVNTFSNRTVRFARSTRRSPAPSTRASPAPITTKTLVLEEPNFRDFDRLTTDHAASNPSAPRSSKDSTSRLDHLFNRHRHRDRSISPAARWCSTRRFASDQSCSARSRSERCIFSPATSVSFSTP
ncbi:MAG: hypothetical protein MZU97_00765 [Bacillus subtilis]|nr:hypothetical protein [Bacillus subtilis]